MEPGVQGDLLRERVRLHLTDGHFIFPSALRNTTFISWSDAAVIKGTWSWPLVFEEIWNMRAGRHDFPDAVTSVNQFPNDGCAKYCCCQGYPQAWPLIDLGSREVQGSFENTVFLTVELTCHSAFPTSWPLPLSQGILVWNHHSDFLGVEYNHMLSFSSLTFYWRYSKAWEKCRTPKYLFTCFSKLITVTL